MPVLRSRTGKKSVLSGLMALKTRRAHAHCDQDRKEGIGLGLRRRPCRQAALSGRLT